MDNRRSDLEINNNVRRELVILRIDDNSLKYGSSGGNVYVSGEIRLRGGNKSSKEMAKFLKKLEDRIKGISGVKAIDIKLKGWEKTPGGDWISLDGIRSKNEPIPSSAPKPKKAPIQKINLKNISVVEKKCPECERIVTHGVKFCEECGEKLELEQLTRQIAKCENCNIVIRGNIKFCGNCGGEVKPIEHKTIIATCIKCGFTKNKSFNFCGQCGANINELFLKSSKPKKETTSKFSMKDDFLNEKINKEIENMKQQSLIENEKVEDEENLTKKEKILRLLEKGKQNSLNKSKWKK